MPTFAVTLPVGVEAPPTTVTTRRARVRRATTRPGLTLTFTVAPALVGAAGSVVVGVVVGGGVVTGVGTGVGSAGAAVTVIGSRTVVPVVGPATSTVVAPAGRSTGSAARTAIVPCSPGSASPSSTRACSSS